MKQITFHSVANQYGYLLCQEDPVVISESGIKYYVVVDIIGVKYQLPIEQTMFEIEEWKRPNNIENVASRYINAVKELLGDSTGVAIKNKK